MSIIDTLITDRTAADTAALETLFSKARAGSLTEEERAILADPSHKGAYNYTDLNRVSAALESGNINKVQTLYIFTQHSHKASNITGQATAMKLYAHQIYDNGALARDYVPCINPDGAAGLYDLVEGKFYGNAGSGSFTIGTVVDPPSEPDDEIRDPHLWYKDDIPAAAEMTHYLQNVSAIRTVLAALPITPSVPADMEGLTAAEANAIEVILIDVETLINNMIAAWLFCGDVYSGEV